MILKITFRPNLFEQSNFFFIRKMSMIPKKKFNNGREIPVLGLGTYKVYQLVHSF